MRAGDAIARAREALQAAERISALTGAGISAESGVPTFRGQDGLWQGFSAQELASPEGFAAHPGKVWEWYNWRRELLMDVAPNPGHLALTELAHRKAFPLATQNVDRLHQKAGFPEVLELHGSIWDVRCTASGRSLNRTSERLPPDPRCTCGARLRPGVVWFGEALPEGAMETAAAWAAAADVFLVVGTSAVVYPAAGLVATAKHNRAKVIEINIEDTPATGIADFALRGPSGEILPELLEGWS